MGWGASGVQRLVPPFTQYQGFTLMWARSPPVMTGPIPFTERAQRPSQNCFVYVSIAERTPFSTMSNVPKAHEMTALGSSASVAARS